MGWPVGRVLYAEAWRPSIYECRCRHPPAIYPRTRAGSPRTCAHPVQARDFLILLQVGFTDPAGSPRSLVVSYTTVSPLPPGKPGGGLFSVALSRGLPRVGVTHHLALWSPDLPRGVSSTRSPGQPIREKDRGCSADLLEQGDDDPLGASDVGHPDAVLVRADTRDKA